MLGDYYMNRILPSRICSHLLAIGGIRLINTFGKMSIFYEDQHPSVNFQSQPYREIHR